MFPLEPEDLDEIAPFPNFPGAAPLGAERMAVLRLRVLVARRNAEWWVQEYDRAAADPVVAARLNRPL